MRPVGVQGEADLLCPKVSITTRAGTSWASSSEAQAWRRSWKRCRGRPARRRMRWKRRVTLIARVERRPERGPQHQVVDAGQRFDPGRPLHNLAPAVPQQRLAHDPRQGHHTAARDRLGLDEGEHAVHPLEGGPHRDGVRLKVDVPPAQAQDLALLEPHPDRDQVERLKALVAEGGLRAAPESTTEDPARCRGAPPARSGLPSSDAPGRVEPTLGFEPRTCCLRNRRIVVR